MATKAQRYGHLAALMQWTVETRAQWDYTQTRPMPGVVYYGYGGEQRFYDHIANGGTFSTDCSGALCLMFQFCEMGDPSGPTYNWNGAGWGGSFESYLGKGYTNAKYADVGAICDFGPWGQDVHVTIVAQRDDKDPLLWSHGSNAGPGFVRLSGFTSMGGAFSTYRFLPITVL